MQQNGEFNQIKQADMEASVVTIEIKMKTKHLP